MAYGPWNYGANAAYGGGYGGSYSCGYGGGYGGSYSCGYGGGYGGGGYGFALIVVLFILLIIVGTAYVW